MATRQTTEVTGWVGWIYFAAFMLVISGGMQVLSGFAAIFSQEFFVVTEQHLLLFDYTAWGWLNVFVGLTVFTIGSALISGQQWAQAAAVIATVLAALTHISFLNAFPLWGIIALIVDGLVLYALLAHGSEQRQQ